MVIGILKDKINSAIKSNKSLRNYLSYNFNSPDIAVESILNELNDFLLSKSEVYKFNNFKNLFYDDIINQFDNHRFANLIRKIMIDSPEKERTYQHILNDIEDRLHESYKIDKKYLTMSRYQLDMICDNFLLEGEISSLINMRKFIKENFRIYDFYSHVYENKNLALKILRKVGQDKDDNTYLRIAELLKNNPGYLGFFTYLNKIEKVQFARLKNLYNIILFNRDILNLLPENVVEYMNHKLPYKVGERTYTNHYERLYDDLVNIRDIHNAKLLSDEYPINLRKDITNISDFVECSKILYSNKEKMEMYKKFFLKKISRYKTKEDLIKTLTEFVYNDNNRKIKNIVDNNGFLDIVHEDINILVIRARDHDDLKRIASDTSWCIKDSLSYWMSYVNYDTIQLVILLTDKPQYDVKSKIGVTLNRNGNNYSFYTAHLKNDSYIAQSDLDKILKDYDTSLLNLYRSALAFGYNEYHSEEDARNDEYY